MATETPQTLRQAALQSRDIHPGWDAQAHLDHLGSEGHDVWNLPCDPIALIERWMTEKVTDITLEIHICDQRRSYLATFATEDQAIAFIDEKKSTHAIHQIETDPIDDGYERLLDVLYPRCEHGLSASLCMGPGHYSHF